MNALLRAAIVAGLASAAAANTLLVDDDGGPGVDFTDLPPAIQAAQDGDLIFVRAGAYSATTIAGKRLTLIAEAGARASLIEVHSVTTAKPVVIVGLEGSYDVHDSTGTVLLDRVGSLSQMAVRAADDVRIQDSFVYGSGGYPYDPEVSAITIGSSQGEPARVELVRSDVIGGDGYWSDGPWDAGNGSDGARLLDGAVFAALSTFEGGDGGDHICCDSLPSAGNGGNGITLLGTSSARVAGPGTQLTGGLPGLNWEDYQYGAPGLPWYGSPTSSFLQDPLDPSLEVVGSAQFGAPTTFRVWAPFGASAELHLGTRPQVLDDGVTGVELLVKPLRTFDLGTVPYSGFVDFTLPPVPQLGIGSMVIGQAHVTLVGGWVRRSNSAVAVMVTPVP